MALLVGKDFTTRLENLMKTSERSVVVFSAFIKADAFQWLSELIPEGVNLQVVARWRKRDLLCGASDLAVYELCRDRGWSFGIDLQLHGKMYLVDSTNILLGSANLTNSGLSITRTGNIEVGVEAAIDSVDLGRIDKLSNEVVWLDDALFGVLSNEVLSHPKDRIFEGESEWSVSVRADLEKPIEYLWVAELIMSSPETLLSPNLSIESTYHDFSLLDLGVDDFSPERLVYCFRRTRFYFWVKGHLNTHGSCNFGSLSALLHSSLLDDPAPYRKQVKEFVVVMFEWFIYLDDEFEVVKHSHTRSVSRKPAYDVD